MSAVKSDTETSKNQETLLPEISGRDKYLQSKSKKTLDKKIDEVQARIDSDRNIEPKSKSKDKSDFSVSEKVIDKNTALILYRYRNSGFLNSIHGCVSTGKEANVYYAVGGKKSKYTHLAIKVFKINVLDYKDRRRYLEGDYRLKYWNVGKNTHRIVRKWAEKEMRNLIRLERAGIPAPKPLRIQQTILLMEFLGEEGVPYPTLKNASISEYMLNSIFMQGVEILKRLFFECRLIHADFSEYNILVSLQPISKEYENELTEENEKLTENFGNMSLKDDSFSEEKQLVPKLYVIDVSQAIENQSLRAFDFLKEDINNFLLFVSKRGLIVPSLKFLFNLITDDKINTEEFLRIVADKMIFLSQNPDSDEVYLEDPVFLNTYIERNLNCVENYEDPNIITTENINSEEESASGSDSIDESSFDRFYKEENFSVRKEKETPEEKRARRKENKTKVKLDNKIKRMSKFPKNEKKKLINKSRNSNKR